MLFNKENERIEEEEKKRELPGRLKLIKIKKKTKRKCVAMENRVLEVGLTEL